MKQKDIAVLAVIIVVSGIVSLIISNYIFNKPAVRQQKVITVGVITSIFIQPSTVYFNSNSIDPTQNINVQLNNSPSTNIFSNPSNTGR